MQTNWYLIYCKPRQELRAQQQLANQGFGTFLPLITIAANPLKPAAQKTEPPFPRYLFLKAQNLEFFHKIRSTRGVVNMVKFGQQLSVSVQNNQLQSIKKTVSHKTVIKQ